MSSQWISETYGVENGEIEYIIDEGNFSCHAFGKKAFIDTKLSCFFFQLPFFLENWGFGYAALSLVIPIIIISIFGKIKQSYRWFILNQAIWDFFIIYSFICDKPTLDAWFKPLYTFQWFKFFKHNSEEWFKSVNQGPPTCFYSSALDSISNENPLKHIIQSIFFYASEDASYAPLLLLTLSRFVTLYYKYWYDRFINTTKSILFIILFSVLCITIVNLNVWYRLATAAIIKDDYLKCNSSCSGEYGNMCRNNCTFIYYRIVNIPYFQIAQHLLPPIILISSNIFAFLLIFKVVKQFKYQAKYNRTNFHSSIKITCVVLFQCLTMTFLLTISSFKNYLHIMQSLRIYRDNNIQKDWPSWMRFITLESTVQCFNVIRIFLDSFVVLFFLKEYRRTGYSFFRFIVILIIRPKTTLKNLMSKPINCISPEGRIVSSGKVKVDMITSKKSLFIFLVRAISTFPTLNEDNNDLKKQWKNENTLKTTNESTLSLHIAAYENSVPSDLFGENENIEGFKREKLGPIKDSKQCFTDGLKFQNPFEFPRQQNGDQKNKPEVGQFKTSQRLLRPRSSAAPPCPGLSNMGRNSTKKTPKKTPAEKTKKYVVEKILAKRLIGNTTEYLIKWKSYSHSENSWEPAANCVDCPAVIKQFEEKQSKKVGKKRSAPVAASQNSGPPAKKTRTSASAPAKSTPRTRRRTSTASTQRSETPSSSAGLIHLKRNRRNASSTPKLVPQQVSFEFSSPPNNSALSPVNYNYSPNEVPVSTHYRTAERLESTLPLETTRDGSSSSDIIFVETVKKNDQSLPATQPVNDDENLPTNEMLTPQGEDNVKNDQSLPATQPVNDDENLPTNEMLTPHVEDDVSIVPSYFKTMRNADKNIEMAEELLKCPDKFYVFISLGILKDNLHDNHKELLYAIEQLNNKGDKLGLIADKVEKIQVTHREIEAALENLLPSSRLAQHASPPQDETILDSLSKNEAAEKESATDVDTQVLSTVQDVEDQSAAVEDDKGTQLLDTVEDETVLDSLSKNEAAEKESATDVDTQVLDTVLDVEDQSVAVEDDKGTQLLGTVPDHEDQSAAVEDDKGTQHLDTVQDETVLDSISKNEVAKEESVINLDTTVLDTVQDVEDQSDAAVEDDKGTQLLDTVEDETVLDSTPKNEVGEEKSAIDVDTQLLDTVQDVEDQSAAAVEDDKGTQLLDSTPKNEVAEEKSADVDTQVLDTVQDEKINNIENLGAAESAKTIEGESKSNEEKVGEEL